MQPLFLVLPFLVLATTLASPLPKARPNPGRIIGGIESNEAQYPFAAAVYVTTATGKYFCGGSLLNRLWIISSGQCVDGATVFDIILGSIYLDNEDPSWTKVVAREYQLHPEYDGNRFLNDLGLIKLTLPISFTDYIKPVLFPPTADLEPGNLVRAIGWGQTSDDEAGPVNELRWVIVSVLSNDECKVFYQDQVQETMVCVSGDYNEGTCIGDMGSPLMQVKTFFDFIQVGVASFLSGNGCESTDPSGFTRIFPYVDWILSTANVTNA